MAKQSALEKKNSQAQRASEPNASRRGGMALAPPNQTGLPDNLKAGVEQLSGLSLDDVRVHYNSPKPAGLQALAYTQGTDIHVGPGQERHLPHEVWHIVQQKQGRVKPTLELKGQPVNDESGLEKEADRMGRRSSSAQSGRSLSPAAKQTQPQASIQRQVIQRHTIGNFYTVNPAPTLTNNQLQTAIASVGQGKHVTRQLQPGQYLGTYGFTACIVLAIWDPVASVASLAHFDSYMEPSDITDMINEMLGLGATLQNIQFAAIGNDQCQTLQLLWNCLDPRLNAQPLPQLSYPPPDPPIQGPPNLYYATVAFLTGTGPGGE